MSSVAFNGDGVSGGKVFEVGVVGADKKREKVKGREGNFSTYNRVLE